MFNGIFEGSTREGELQRTADMLKTTLKEQDVYYTLAFLYDSGYERKDIKDLMAILETRLGYD